MDFYKGSIPILDYDTPAGRDLAHPRGVGYGLTPRDYSVDPPTMFDPPSSMPLIPESEWDARYDEEEKTESSLEHVYLRGGKPAFINLDQDGHGYCWAYSTGTAIMLLRLSMNQPLVRINPHATAAIIKRGADEGGWCGLSAKFAREHGYAIEGDGPGEWPLHSRDLRYDTPELRKAMALHKVTEEWVDLARDVYDVELSKQQYATALMSRFPCPSDYNHWSHSVCALRWVRIERGNWGELILNSWKGWGRHGLAVMQGSKSVPNSMLALRCVPGSEK